MILTCCEAISESVHASLSHCASFILYSCVGLNLAPRSPVVLALCLLC